MAQQTINIGTVANDGTGDTARDAFDKVNDNFTELYGIAGPLDNYAYNAGVTGVNDGTVDDTPALQAAYTAAVAAGANSLILPIGDVWLKSYTQDASYPYSYVIRCAADDFTIVVPEGCVIHSTPVDDGQGGTDAAKYWDLFQFTGERSGITGGGRFVHETPGYTSTTPNNYNCCVHLTSPANDCFITNLTADGFCAVNGTFDDSSSFTGSMANLRVRICNRGVTQTNSQTTKRCTIVGCHVSDYYKLGFQIEGRRVLMSGCKADDVNGASSTDSSALYIGGLGEGVMVNGFQAAGPYTNGSGANTRSGINISPSTFDAGAPIVINGFQVDGMSQAIAMTGAVNKQIFTGVAARNCHTLINKSANGANHCGDTFFNGLIADTLTNGYSQNWEAGAVSEGIYWLSNTSLTTVTTPYRTATSVRIGSNVYPTPAPSYRADDGSLVTSTVTTKQNDYAPTGWAAAKILRWNGAGSTGITGFSATDVAHGDTKTIVNASTAYLLWLEHANTASAAANRLDIPKGFPAFLLPGDSLTIYYDSTSTVWRVISWPSQGMAMGFTEFSDFLHYNTSTSAGPISAVTSGTGSSLANGYEFATKMAGKVKLSTGTTTTGYASLGGYQAAIYDTAGFGAFVGASAGVVTATDGTETFSLTVGLDWGDAATSTHNIVWEYWWNGSAAEIAYTVTDNGTPTRATSGAPSPTSPALTSTPFKFFVFAPPGWDRADFIYSTDGMNCVLAASVSSGLPAANAPRFAPAVSLKKSAGTTARLAIVDWMGYRIFGTTRT